MRKPKFNRKLPIALDEIITMAELIQLRVSHADKKAMKEAARLCRMSVADYIRHLHHAAVGGKR